MTSPPATQPVRARYLGIPFDGTPGQWNAITDVPGVEVGYRTLIQGDRVRTGVTAIHPRGAAGAGDPVVAGFFSQNGNGEMTGLSWIEESGTFSGPVGITNTHAVGVVHAGIVAWTIKHYAAGKPDAYDVLRFVPSGALDPFHAAVVQATEEAVANALAAGEDITGRDGHRSPGLPRAQVAELFRDRHRA